jgi:hypothetical protein
MWIPSRDVHQWNFNLRKPVWFQQSGSVPTNVVMQRWSEDMLEAGKYPDESLLHIVDSGEEVHRLAQLMGVRLLHQLRMVFAEIVAKQS